MHTDSGETQNHRRPSSVIGASCHQVSLFAKPHRGRDERSA